MNPTPSWKISVDEGEKFTHCLAINDCGIEKQLDISNSGVLRATVVDTLADGEIQLNCSWGFQKDILAGYLLRLVNHPNKTVRIHSFNPTSRILKLEFKFNELKPGTEIEILSIEIVPILAARIITNTALNEPFPKIDMQLNTVLRANDLFINSKKKLVLITTRGFSDDAELISHLRKVFFPVSEDYLLAPYYEVIEVDESIDANGKIIKPLPEWYINTLLKKIFELRNSPIIIALNNSAVNPLHEQILMNLLKVAGFKNLSAAHQTDYTINNLNYRQTSIFNACLSPMVQSFWQSIKKSLGKESTLMIVTNNSKSTGF